MSQAINRMEAYVKFTQPLIRDWTVEQIATKAANLGKVFEPNPQIANRLAADLANGALVLFTANEVSRAVEQNLLPNEWQEGVTNLVSETGENDIAVIPTGNIPNWESNLAIWKTGRAMKMW